MDEAKQGDTCTVDRILAIILEDPARLDRARERSLLDPRKDPNLRPVHQWKLTRDRDASMPCKQFGDEVNEELNRLAQDDADRTHSIPCHTYNHHLVAEENVKKKWKVEGIWNDKWTPLGPDPWLWKHEESLSSGSPATDQQRREREASRPFHRFMYQVSQERQRIQEPFMRFVRLRAKHSRPVEGAPPIDETNIPETWASLDINARAYQRVKDAWVERGIWYDKWGVLPGMTWKHEHSLEDMLLEELGPSPPAEDVGLSEPVPAASSVPNNGTHERAGGERPFEEWHSLSYGLGHSLPLQPQPSLPFKGRYIASSLPSPFQSQHFGFPPPLHTQQTVSERSQRDRNTLSPIRSSDCLPGKRKQGADASDKGDGPCGSEAESSGDHQTKKRR